MSWSDAVAVDNTGSLSVTSDIASGSNFSVGETTVTYTTSDGSGNTASCSFTVTIIGKEIVIVIVIIDFCSDSVLLRCLNSTITMLAF